MRSLFLGAFALISTTSADCGDLTAPVSVKPILQTEQTWSQQPIRFPSHDGSVVAALYDVAPGAVLPVHKHPFPRLGYVLSGTLKVTDLDTGQSKTWKAGEFIVESLDQWHEGASIGQTPLRLLVIDLIENGAKNTIIRSETDAQSSVIQDLRR
jgi:quercetin dioxygenase-like cupin family protein